MKKRIKGIYKSIILRLSLTIFPIIQNMAKWLSVITSILSLTVIVLLVYALGFSNNFIEDIYLPLFTVAFYAFFCEYTVALFYSDPSRKIKRTKTAKITLYVLYSVIVILSIIWMLPSSWLESYIDFYSSLRHQYLMICIVTAEALLKLSIVITSSLTTKLDPQWIMVGSFLLLIGIGTGMLLLPRSTYFHVSVVDTLFITVSSVCVTGLTTIDVPNTFTLTGQIILLLLIQFGGIGIMTFTSFFGLMINGSHSAQNKMLIKDLIDPDNSVSQIFTTLRNTIFIALIIELIGAFCIYSAIDNHSLYGFYIALFHAVSAFCNAGISIIPDGLYNVALRDNYALLHIVSWLIILGGIGFPILFNIWQWLKSSLHIFIRRISGKFQGYKKAPHILTSNTIIVLVITFFLIVSGTIIFFITEYDNLFAGKSLWGKYTLSFFLSVTPRTAGFNAFPMGSMMPVTIMFLILYMWVGGSPMSTAGGIKTTTLGIALLNVWNTLRGRNQIELRRRTISSSTTYKAFIIMFVSLCVIVTGIMLIIIFEPGKSILAIVFEVVSAFSTVGLSLDLTPYLCMASKIVLICIMFIGRMGLLTILGCMISENENHFYSYPSEHIPIN